MPKSRKKNQEPAYKVQGLLKEEDIESMSSVQHEQSSLLGDPPQRSHYHQPSRFRAFFSPGRQSVQSKQASRGKSSGAPTRSLMSIDFSSRSLSSGRHGKQDMPSHCDNSSDDESHKRYRYDWKSGSKEQNHLELANCGGNSMQPSPAPLIVDLAPRTMMGVGSQPRSLLGDYWTATAQKPASLLDFIPNDNTVRENLYASHRSQESKKSRQEGLKRKRQSQPAHEVSQRKILKTDDRERRDDDGSHRLTVCNGLNQAFVLIPSTCSTCYLHGRAKVRVVQGRVAVLGHSLVEGRQYDIYSPTSNSLLALNCASESKYLLSAEKVKDLLSQYRLLDKEKGLDKLGNNTVAILQIDRLESAVCDFITSFSPYTQLFTAPVVREKEAHTVRGVSLLKLGMKIAPVKEMGPVCMSMSHEYEHVLTRFTVQLSKMDPELGGKPPPVWLCCGAKNSGKSTFCRMLINTALKSVDAVGYLECDVGQTEFSAPATISFHVIKQPVLGQPFCHQRYAERQVFYGEVAAGTDPSLYMACLRYVFEAYKEMADKPPLVVNTMGFPEGIGLMLMIDTVRLVCPNMVVQIESHNQALNLPAITHELVALEEGWTYNKEPITDPKLQMEKTNSHELILLPTLVNHRREFSLKLKPVDLRNLSLLASLSLGLEAGLTVISLPPYTVRYSQLAVHVCHHRLSGRDILGALEASVVALCTADLSETRREGEGLPLLFDEMPVCDCLGLAIVRAVDERNGLLFMVTSLPKVSLEKVNTVLKGCLSLPDQLILKQTAVGSSPLPYVDALAPSTGVTAVRPRARMPRLTLGQP